MRPEFVTRCSFRTDLCLFSTFPRYRKLPPCRSIPPSMAMGLTAHDLEVGTKARSGAATNGSVVPNASPKNEKPAALTQRASRQRNGSDADRRLFVLGSRLLRLLLGLGLLLGRRLGLGHILLGLGLSLRHGLGLVEQLHDRHRRGVA